MVHINNDMVQSWLELQCSMVSGVTGALVLLGTPESDGYGPTACWEAVKLTSAPVSGSIFAAW